MIVKCDDEAQNQTKTYTYPAAANGSADYQGEDAETQDCEQN